MGSSIEQRLKQAQWRLSNGVSKREKCPICTDIFKFCPHSIYETKAYFQKRIDHLESLILDKKVRAIVREEIRKQNNP